jgi:hypothetical protein
MHIKFVRVRVICHSLFVCLVDVVQTTTRWQHVRPIMSRDTNRDLIPERTELVKTFQNYLHEPGKQSRDAAKFKDVSNSVC